MVQDIRNNIRPCGHAHHLLEHPLCKQQSVIKRVGQLAFHIITLGLAFVFSKIYHRFTAKKNLEMQKLAAKEPEVKLNNQQILWQKLWDGSINWICKENIFYKQTFFNLFDNLYRLDRDFALPLTEEQRKILGNFIEGKDIQPHDAFTIAFLAKEILEVAALPVPTTADEKWHHALGMIQRMRQLNAVIEKQLDVFREAGQDIPEEFRDLLHSFNDHLKGCLYELILNSFRMFKEAKLPQVNVEIPMEASTVEIYGVKQPTLPQKLIWEPSSGKLTAHLEFFLSGVGKQEKIVDMRAHSNERLQKFASEYAGCHAPYIQENNLTPEELEAKQKKEEEECNQAFDEGLTWVQKEPEPVFLPRGEEYPQGGLSFAVMLQMFDKIIA